MNQEERVEFHRKTEGYFEKNQIKDLFRQMTKEVLLDLPEDPIQWFIDHLKRKSVRKIICVVGHNQVINDKVCKMIGSDFGYEIIENSEEESKTALGQNLSKTYDHYNEILKAGTDKCGFVFKNFPTNINQALWFSRNRVIPERIFMITSSPGKEPASNSVSQKDFLAMKNLPDVQTIRQVNFDVVRDFYKDIVYDIALDQMQSDMDEIFLLKAVRNIMTIRHREITPKRPPRIIFLGYPSNFFSK